MDVLISYLGQLLQGASITLQLAFTALFFGLVLGLLFTACKLSSLPLLRVPVNFLTSLLRGIPEFLIILICYFGLSNLINEHLDGAFEISPFVGGVFALSIVFSAYASEVFRGGFVAVPAGQIEAAKAYGLSRSQVFFSIQLPQAWRIALPSLSNLWQSLLKDTSLVSVVGLEDLLKKADMAAQFSKQPFVFFMAVAVIYFLFLSVSNPVFAWLEKRASRGYRVAGA
ncbi:amino acid ABC transporter permease [Hydrogenophaga crassostreae]|uniref:Amino acid ABC transporter permease n=1 Tax=Hydrogenophaga crassostreae TaxID=1763535 RepID=A0A167GEA3_9BURK|nr:ABC transporter permease subunit [Hydrogenophaga crassostreae]AOW11495.1 amino acid ABC transporter permease [Hydrogenophaga crassostreae]OAD39335.1 amino acid ABC transporter permease [Hydrogenophaga crassostreae]